MTSLELRKQRAPLAARIRELANKANSEKRDFSAEENSNWEQVNRDYDALTAQIERAERADKVERESAAPAGDPRIGREDRDGRPGGEARRAADPEDEPEDGLAAEPDRSALRRNRDFVSRREAHGLEARAARDAEGRLIRPATDEQRALALQAWMRRQSGIPLTRRHVEACRAVGLHPASRNLDLRLASTAEYRALRHEQRALSASSGAAGGVTIAPGFVNQFELAMLAFGGMRSVAEVMRTETGTDLPWPTGDDTSNEGVEVGENADISTEAEPTFGALTLKAWKYTSKMVKVPFELLEDSAFNLASVLAAMLAERLARITNRRYTTGTGAAQPTGIVTAATLGKTAASATAIAADEILDLIHAIDPAYRPQSSFMFHDNILLALRKLKDGQGNYLWTSGNVQIGAPDRMHNYPYTINQHMASSVATTNKTVLFGDLSKYKIRDVGMVRIRRLVERYADTDQEGYVALLRTDGGLLTPGTPVKYLQQA